MTCDKVLDLMTAYIDNELTEEEYLQISIHLEQCAECSAVYEYVQAMQETFRDVPEVDPPVELRKNVMATIAEEEQKTKENLGWKWKRVVAALVIFTLSVATGLYPIVAMYNSAASPPTQEGYKLTGIKESETYSIVSEVDQGPTGLEQEPQTRSTKSQENVEVAEHSDEGSETTEGTSILSDQYSAQGDIPMIADEDDKLAPKNLPAGSYTAADEHVQTEPKWYSIIKDERMLFAITGIFLSLIMLWYARPRRGKQI